MPSKSDCSSWPAGLGSFHGRPARFVARLPVTGQGV
jgi:hypothetical protein